MHVNDTVERRTHEFMEQVEKDLMHSRNSRGTILRRSLKHGRLSGGNATRRIRCRPFGRYAFRYLDC